MWYPHVDHQHNKGSSQPKHLHQKNIDVDILLNLEDQILMIGIVGEIDDEHEYKFEGIPKTNELGGWVPFFNASTYEDSKGCELRIAEIPHEMYGEISEQLFECN